MLKLDDVAAETGEAIEALRAWQALGLIGDAEGQTFAADDVERVRLVRMCLRRGFQLDAVAEAERTSGALTRALRSVLPHDRGTRVAVDDAAALLGLDPAFVRRLWVVIGAGEEERLAPTDVEALRILATFHSLGFPEDALLEGTRVFVDCLSRVAEAEGRLFHIHVHERLKASGLSGLELLEATTGLGDEMRPMLEPSVLYFHRKGWERAVREDMLDHLAEDLGLAPPAEVPGELRRALLFTDLSGFTPLTAAVGDLEAARVLDAFSDIVRWAVSRHDGHVVKQIGDEFFMIFPEPTYAVACALEIESRAAEAPELPGVRSGIHWGSVLYREGDYVGTTVNVASRVAGEAERGQVLVTERVRRAVPETERVVFVPAGARRLKGIHEHVELFEAQSRDSWLS